MSAADLAQDLFDPMSGDIVGLQLFGSGLQFSDPFNVNNAHFLYSLSGLSSLLPVVSNQVVIALPGTALLLVPGLFALFAPWSRRRPSLAAGALRVNSAAGRSTPCPRPARREPG